MALTNIRNEDPEDYEDYEDPEDYDLPTEDELNDEMEEMNDDGMLDVLDDYDDDKQ